MSAEHASHFIESVLSQTSFVRGFLADPTSPTVRDEYTRLYSDVAKAAGYGTRGHFNSEYVERRYADMAYDGLFPHGLGHVERDITILAPIFAGYELRTLKAISLLAPRIMSTTFSECQIEVPQGRENDALSWVVSQMEYGADLYRRNNPIKADSPELNPFRDFINSLDI